MELEEAENLLLPRFDARLEASKDVGGPADEKGDKTPFELEAGLWSQVPLKRRQARGKSVAPPGPEQRAVVDDQVAGRDHGRPPDGGLEELGNREDLLLELPAPPAAAGSP